MTGNIGNVYQYKSLKSLRRLEEEEERALREYYYGNPRFLSEREREKTLLVIPRGIPSDLLTYKSPLTQRYKHGTESMAFNFSDYKKFVTWRRLWLWLAKAQQVVKRKSILLHFNPSNPFLLNIINLII